MCPQVEAEIEEEDRKTGLVAAAGEGPQHSFLATNP